MTKEEAIIALRELQAILDLHCNCEVCFNVRVYIEKRKIELNKIINEL